MERSQDNMVESVIRMLKAKTPEVMIMETVLRRPIPHQLTGSDRARLEDAGASENLIAVLENPSAAPSLRNAREPQNQKAAACREQATQQFPNDNVSRSRAIADCMRSR